MAMECPKCMQRFSEGVSACPVDGTRLEPEGFLSGDVFLGRFLGGQYRIVDLVGEGGIGIVYRARQESVGRDVAVKVLRRRYMRQDSVVRRFENEARVISQLRHPNTLRLFDCRRAETGELFIVTELLQGQSLHGLLQEGPLPALRVISIAEQICGSLSEAHAAGIVHRDLKPENIYLDRVGGEDHVKVLDFGIAKLLEDDSMQTQANTVVGTPTYMSPEQANGQPADPRSDVYALGIVLYEMLTGEPPFRGETMVSILYQHIHEAPPPLSSSRSIGTSVPVELEALVLAMLNKSPEDRPESVDGVRERLRKIRLDLERRDPSARARFPSSGTEQVRVRPSAGEGESARVRADDASAILEGPDVSHEPSSSAPAPSLPDECGRPPVATLSESLSLDARYPFAKWAAGLALLAGLSAIVWWAAPAHDPDVITVPVEEAVASGGGTVRVRITSDPPHAEVIAPDGVSLGTTELEVSIDGPATYRVLAPGRQGIEIRLDPLVDGGRARHVVLPPEEGGGARQDSALSREGRARTQAASSGGAGRSHDSDPLPSAPIEDGPIPVDVE